MQYDTSFYVYVHKKKTDGTIFYVGKGKGRRAYQMSNRSMYWDNVSKKHGVDVEITHIGLTESQSFYIEKKMIQKIGRENLVNLTPGGEGNSDPWKEETRSKRVAAIQSACNSEEWIRKNHEFTKSDWYRSFSSERSKRIFSIPEIKNKHSESIKAWASSKENRERVSRQWKGVKRTQSTREKMSQSQKDIKRSQERLNAIADIGRKYRKPIICIEEGIEFSCVGDAAKWLRNNGSKQKQIESNIRNALKLRKPTACGYTWRYAGVKSDG